MRGGGRIDVEDPRMSMQVGSRLAHQPYLHVKCPCGRELRARSEQAGSHITCWSCHASVPVPIPVAPGGWVARLLRMAARQILDARIVTLLAIGAVLVTLSLSLSSLDHPVGHAVKARGVNPGVWSAALALGLVMVGYGELLRRGCQGDWTPRPAVGLLTMAWRALICLATGTALVMPLVIAAVRDTPPRLTAAGLAIAAACILIFPLVMLATYLPHGSIGRRMAVVGSMLRRHPMAVLASLLALPLSLLAIELALVLVARMTFTFAFLVVDVFPPRESITVLFRMPYYMTTPARGTWVDINDASDSVMFGLYGQSLRQGYTLLGAIPASLALGRTSGYDTLPLQTSAVPYLLYRMGFTLLIVAGMLSALAVQARWLGLLSTIDSRRSSVTEAPST
jgi:hypothetical protein